MVEYLPPKQDAAGSSPVYCSKKGVRMDNKGIKLTVGNKYCSRLSEDESGFWTNDTRYDGVMLIVTVTEEPGSIVYTGTIESGFKAYGKPGGEISFGDQSPLHLALSLCENDEIFDLSLSLDDLF